MANRKGLQPDTLGVLSYKDLTKQINKKLPLIKKYINGGPLGTAAAELSSNISDASIEDKVMNTNTRWSSEGFTFCHSILYYIIKKSLISKNNLSDYEIDKIMYSSRKPDESNYLEDISHLILSYGLGLKGVTFTGGYGTAHEITSLRASRNGLIPDKNDYTVIYGGKLPDNRFDDKYTFDLSLTNYYAKNVIELMGKVTHQNFSFPINKLSDENSVARPFSYFLGRNGYNIYYNNQTDNGSKQKVHNDLINSKVNSCIILYKKNTPGVYIKKNMSIFKEEILAPLNAAYATKNKIEVNKLIQDKLNNEKTEEADKKKPDGDILVVNDVLVVDVYNNKNKMFEVKPDNYSMGTHRKYNYKSNDRIYVKLLAGLADGGSSDLKKVGGVRIYKCRQIKESENTFNTIHGNITNNPLLYGFLFSHLLDNMKKIRKNFDPNKLKHNGSFLDLTGKLFDIDNVLHDRKKVSDWVELWNTPDDIHYWKSIATLHLGTVVAESIKSGLSAYNNFISSNGEDDAGTSGSDPSVKIIVITNTTLGGNVINTAKYRENLNNQFTDDIIEYLENQANSAENMTSSKASEFLSGLSSDNEAKREETVKESTDSNDSANTNKIDFSFEKNTDPFWNDVGEVGEDEISRGTYHPYTGEDYYNNPTAYMKLGDNYIDYARALNKFIFSPKLTYGIGGMPASFLPTTDPPMWSTADRAGLGLNYIEHYIKYGQFVAFRPCVQSYDNIFADTHSSAKDSENPSKISTLFGRVASGTLVKLIPRMDKYWEQVTRLCRIAIHLMGIEKDQFDFDIGPIGDVSDVDNSKGDGSGNGLKAYNNKALFGAMRAITWGSIGESFAQMVGSKVSYVRGGTDAAKTVKGTFVENEVDAGIVTFMIHGPVEDTDSLTNNDGDSHVAGVISNMIGGGPTPGFQDFMAKIANTVGGTIGSAASYLAGTYMIPKIWTGSGYEKSQTYTFKFSTDSGDPVSRFLNVIYPLIKLYVLALPEATGGLLFTPWILNTYSSANTNIDFGLIRSLQVKKSMLNLSDSGIPGEVDATVSLMDLRPFLFIEKPKWWSYASKYNGSATIMIATLVGQNVTTISKRDNRELKKTLSRLNYADVSSELWPNFILKLRRGLSRFQHYVFDKRDQISDKVVNAGAFLSGITGGDPLAAATESYLNTSTGGLSNPNGAGGIGLPEGGFRGSDPNDAPFSRNLGATTPSTGDFTGIEGVDTNDVPENNDTNSSNNTTDKPVDKKVEEFNKQYKDIMDRTNETANLMNLMRYHVDKRDRTYSTDKDYGGAENLGYAQWKLQIYNFLESAKKSPQGLVITGIRVIKEDKDPKFNLYEISGLIEDKKVIYRIGGRSNTNPSKYAYDTVTNIPQ